MSSNVGLEPLPPYLNHELCESVAEQFGTPTVIYDEATLAARAEEALAFPNVDGLTVRYAMKANPHRQILGLFDSMGLSVDASSGFEARRAIMAGVDAAKILLTSQEFPDPKNDSYRSDEADLRMLIGEGVLFNATSPRQLAEYGKNYPSSEVSVRINPSEGSGHSMGTSVGGPTSSFGTWHEKIEELHDIASQYDLKIVRLHTHIGSGSDPEKWSQVAQESLSMVRNFPDVHTLNLGGGFKVARVSQDPPPTDLEAIGQPIKQALEDFKNETGRALHLEIEPGTFLVANAGALITKVVDVVDTGQKGHVFYKVNSGMGENLRPAMYGAEHPVFIVPGDDSGETETAVVVGHNCESSDIITVSANKPGYIEPRKFNRANIGSIAVIGGVGAYGLSMAAKGYNSFPEAGEVMIDRSGKPRMITHPGRLIDLVRREV